MRQSSNYVEITVTDHLIFKHIRILHLGNAC